MTNLSCSAENMSEPSLYIYTYFFDVYAQSCFIMTLFGNSLKHIHNSKEHLYQGLLLLV